MRRILATLAIVAALVLPGSALAADTSGNTAEGGIVVPATISMTVPATGTFEPGGALGDWSYTGALTNIGTNNLSGLTIRQTVEPLTNGATVVPTTKRATTYTEAYDGVVAGAAVAKGGWLDNTTSKVVGVMAAAGTGGTVSHNETILAADIPNVAGTYTSASHFIASTNP